MLPELLAPAGDMERLMTALHFGADAVYAAGPGLHLRAGSVSFAPGELARAVEYTHRKGKKLYVTLNAFAHEDDLPRMAEMARRVDDMGADAAIVSDLGALCQIRQAAPGLEVHISTQANCLNHRAARAYYDMGARRIVLAREMSLTEIARMRENIPPDLKLEAFVHGAMCMSYSGRCVISAHLAGRSANRGDCAQPCRWRYRLTEEKRPDASLTLEGDERGSYVLSARDLNMLEHLDELAAAGVDAFKVEGRMKSPYYVATVINAYRRALDKSAPLHSLRAELDCASHRAYSTGFYFGAEDARTQAGEYRQDCLFVAVVKEASAGMALLEQRNRFARGDVLEVLSPGSMGRRVTVEELWDEAGRPLDAALRPQQLVRLRTEVPLKPWDILRRRLP